MVTVFSRVFFLVSILVISKVWETNSVFSKSKLVKYRNFLKFKNIQRFPNFFGPSGKNSPPKKKNPNH
jgi:hypothetical protein